VLVNRDDDTSTPDRALVYLDNAATVFPKPKEVLEQMVETYARLGASPGRGTYDLAMEAAQFVGDVREQVAAFFGASDPERVVFTANATDALNLAIQGLVGPGDHVISTRLEHNSVLRPLFHLKERGWIDYDLVPFDGQGLVRPEDIAGAIRPNTRLVVVCHGSQVLGTVQPAEEISRVCRERGVPLLLDAAQTAGQVPIEMDAWGVSAIAFTGHKALLGPSGSGGLLVTPDLDVSSTRYGGTGVESHSLRHTQEFPYRLEAGTLNLLGVIGLSLGMRYLVRVGMEESHLREMTLIGRLREGLGSIPGVSVYSPPPRAADLPVLSCNVEGVVPEDAGAILDGDYGIAVRTGLHCAPLVHADLGTAPAGLVRFSLGHANIEQDIDLALAAMAEIAAAVRR
jgi:cysteine desulfurase / selenocysteine lyase